MAIVNNNEYFFIQGGSRSDKLRFVKSHELSDGTTGTEHTGSDGEVIDVIQSPGAQTLTLKVCRARDVRPEVDYKALKESKSRFEWEIREIGGSVQRLTRCLVVTVNHAASDKAEIMEDVTIMAVKNVETR